MSARPRFVSVFAIASAVALSPGVEAADAAAELDELVAAFEARSGARLVFAGSELPDGEWFDIKIELPADRRIEAARLALAEARRYPEGYLGAIGVRAVGVFDGLASSQGDGFRPWNDQLGGYRYFGQWNGRDAIIAAFYTDEQLPLTFHHEVFHHVDATEGGVTGGDAYSGDDERFAAAIAGDQPYPAPVISEDDLAALERRSGGSVLDDAVSDYAAKSPNEDQAETARYLMSALPDALIQLARRPELAGSQRMLHVIDQYSRSAVGGPDVAWLVDVALDRDPGPVRALAARADALDAALRARIGDDDDDDRTFLVWGREDASGVNLTLRGDIARFGKVARALIRAADGVPGADTVLAAALARELRLLDRYQDYIASRWTISAGTERSFARARAALGGEPRGVERDNPYLSKVDDEIADATVRAAIRRVQPATVFIGGGSGVNLDGSGVILTAAHVVDAVGTRPTVRFPDGTEVEAETVALDATLDLAVLTVAGGRDLPHAPIAADAPAIGDLVVVIGQPGKWTPDGEATHYQPWHVSVGEIRGFRGDPLGDQSLGGAKHDAWTYWGHSGSPLFDREGRIVALHNSWDSSTAMRHAVRHEAIIDFLARSGVAYTQAP